MTGLPPADTFPFAATSTGIVVATGAFLLRGWAFQESTDAAGATLAIYDGITSSGKLAAPITLDANESARDYPPGAGIVMRQGMFVDVTIGSVLGSLWATPITHLDAWEVANGEWGDYFIRPGV